MASLPITFLFILFGCLIISQLLRYRASAALTAEQNARLARSLGPHPIGALVVPTVVFGTLTLLSGEPKIVLAGVISLMVGAIITLLVIVLESRRMKRLGIPGTYMRTLAHADSVVFLILATLAGVVLANSGVF